jgi:hypothetical protein
MWNLTKDKRPDDGTLCRVITEGGDERDLIFEKGLWWLPSREMYVYFTPTHWRMK